MMVFRLSRASMQSPDWFSIVNPTPSAKEGETIDAQLGFPKRCSRIGEPLSWDGVVQHFAKTVFYVSLLLEHCLLHPVGDLLSASDCISVSILTFDRGSIQPTMWASDWPATHTSGRPCNVILWATVSVAQRPLLQLACSRGSMMLVVFQIFNE